MSDERHGERMVKAFSDALLGACAGPLRDVRAPPDEVLFAAISAVVELATMLRTDPARCFAIALRIACPDEAQAIAMLRRYSVGTVERIGNAPGGTA